MVELRLEPQTFSVLQGAVAAYVEIREQNPDRLLDFGVEPDTELQAVRNMRDILRNEIPERMGTTTEITFGVPSHLVTALRESIEFIDRLLKSERGGKTLASIGVNPTQNDRVRLRRVLDEVQKQTGSERTSTVPESDLQLMEEEGKQLRQMVADADDEDGPDYDHLKLHIDSYQNEIRRTGEGDTGRASELKEDLEKLNADLSHTARTNCSERVESAAAAVFFTMEAAALDKHSDRDDILKRGRGVVALALTDTEFDLNAMIREDVISECFDPGIAVNSLGQWTNFERAVLTGEWLDAKEAAWDYLEALDSAVHRATN